MLGQADISDVELKRRWRLYWIHCLFEFSNIKLQQMSWVEGEKANWGESDVWYSSFDECISSYFDNLALDDNYVKALAAGNVSDEEAQHASAFTTLAYSYLEPSDDPKEILADPEWIVVVNLAKTFWDYLKGSVTSQREIDLMQKLEKEFT